MIDEILALGFRRVELGYDLTRDLVPGVQQRVRDGAVQVVSVHNFCPVPTGAPRGSPELFLLADLDRDSRERAVEHTANTIRFAAEIGAGAVVAHGGYIRHWRNWMPRLFDQLARDPAAPAVERLRERIERRRERRVERHLSALRASVEKLMPVLEATGVILAFENLPSWESVPSEVECRQLIESLKTNRLGYWHDTGHGQIRENAGFINHLRLFERMLPWLRGVHLHDVRFPAEDHILPPQPEGQGMDFGQFAALADKPIPKVIEPPPGAPGETVRAAAEHIELAWREARRESGS